MESLNKLIEQAKHLNLLGGVVVGKDNKQVDITILPSRDQYVASS